MANIVYIAVSLDGYIADKDGGIEWLINIPNPSNDDFGFSKLMNRIDAVVMGKNTFEAVVSFGKWMYKKPVFVLSHNLHSVPKNLKDKAELVHGDIETIVDGLNKRGLNNLYIDGGQVIQSFLKKDLIDELIITTVPVILGSGIPLFAEINNRLTFSHQKTDVFNNSLIKSHFTRNR